MKLFFKYAFILIMYLNTNYVGATESIYSGRSHKKMTEDSIKRLNEASQKITETYRKLGEYCKYNPCNFRAITNEYYIEKNVDGKYIILDDGSVYQVEDFDTFSASFWMEGAEILVTDSEDKMINLDDNEVIEVYRIK